MKKNPTKLAPESTSQSVVLHWNQLKPTQTDVKLVPLKESSMF